jgi:hypothetical protein
VLARRISTVAPLRVLVTGSRGKSSIVRLLHAALAAAGNEAWARVTGVVPREIGPLGERTLERAAGGHVAEMRWWLRQLPASAGAVVLENSAIEPELQPLAARWLDPQLTVFSSAVPDHQEAWGSAPDAAAIALAQGLPRGGRVLLPASLQEDSVLRHLLDQHLCEVEWIEPLDEPGPFYRALNRGLALAACRHFGIDASLALDAMRGMPPDPYAFRVARRGGLDFALAFSANDLVSSRDLYRSLGWPQADTRVVYNHRRDRPLRLRSFLPWLTNGRWREVWLVGDRPDAWNARLPYRRFRSARQLLDRCKPGDRVFGCGNIAGLPLALYHQETNS